MKKIASILSALGFLVAGGLMESRSNELASVPVHNYQFAMLTMISLFIVLNKLYKMDIKKVESERDSFFDDMMKAQAEVHKLTYENKFLTEKFKNQNQTNTDGPGTKN